MVFTVRDYWKLHTDGMEDTKGLAVRRPIRHLAEIGLVDGDECYGTIDAVIFLDDDVYLGVHERVTTNGDQGGAPSRLEYSYQLVVEGVPIGRWTHDPRFADPDVRFHFDDALAGIRHNPDQHRSLEQVVDLCWTIIDNVQQGVESEKVR